MRISFSAALIVFLLFSNIDWAVGKGRSSGRSSGKGGFKGLGKFFRWIGEVFSSAAQIFRPYSRYSSGNRHGGSSSAVSTIASKQSRYTVAGLLVCILWIL